MLKQINKVEGQINNIVIAITNGFVQEIVTEADVRSMCRKMIKF
ncbi:hypothetical protein [Clostridium chromiireducens]|nr:hypothetical protein [Clostridium chromiireducens]